MRIIAGEAGGIPLLVPDTLTRPTTDRVREALFSSLGDRLSGARVLDLYAGSGALGLEALSRGAAFSTFVDQQRGACDTVAANAKKARLEKRTEIVCHKVLGFLDRRFGSPMLLSDQARDVGGERFGLIFADPPYARDSGCAAEIEALLSSDALVAALDAEGIFVFESMVRFDLPDSASDRWSLARERRYGDTRLSFLRPRPKGGDEALEETREGVGS